jgi:hypothetical protein
VVREPIEIPSVPVPPITAPVLKTPVEIPSIPVPPPVIRPPVVESPAVPVPASTPPVQTSPVEVPPVPVPSATSVAPPRTETTTTAPSDRAPADLRSPTAPPTQEKAPSLPADRAPAVAPERPIKSDSIPRIPDSQQSPFRRTPERKDDFDPTKPLDPEAMRKRAGELAREGRGNRAILPFPLGPPNPEHKSKMETAIENARKPDCRTAYQQLGLLAVIPLVANEFGEGTCKW